MLATYEPKTPGKKLNVRKEPSAASPIIRTMEAGTEAAEMVVRGWVKLADGYADAHYLTVTEGTVESAEAAVEAETTPEEPAEVVETTGDEEARARLAQMTNPELYSLAEESGIKVAKGSNKSELIDAILNGVND